jgi:hypothetical protein
MWRSQIRSIVLCIVTLLSQSASADPLFDGSMLGRSEAKLRATFPNLRLAGKPARGPHGLRGQWLLTDTPLLGLPFETTFFMKNKQVQRIEQLWRSNENECSKRTSFSEIISGMELKFGNDQISGDFTENGVSHQSAVWMTNQIEVTVHYSASASQCAARVVYQSQRVKDASEL